MKFKIGDRVQPAKKGDESLVRRSMRAMRTFALRGRIIDLYTPPGTMAEPSAYVRWSDGTSGTWPLWALERLHDDGHARAQGRSTAAQGETREPVRGSDLTHRVSPANTEEQSQ